MPGELALARRIGSCRENWLLPGELALAGRIGSCRENWLLPGELPHAGRIASCWENWLMPGELALSFNPSYIGGYNCGMVGEGRGYTTRPD